MILRDIQGRILHRLFQGKAVVLLGARQVGKTTLVTEVIKDTSLQALWLDGDEPDVREDLSRVTSARLKNLIGHRRIVVIDEAQRIDNEGLTVKLIVDQIKDVQVIVTGSSSLEIADQLVEPLTGRRFDFTLYPIAFSEMVKHHGLLEEERQIEHRLIFGYYPEIVTTPGDEVERLTSLTSSYLYKDLLMLAQIKRPPLVEKLVRALALQLGSEVSYNELAQIVGADYGTVEKYIDLLEKTFVVFRLPALNRNVRNEIKKGKKIYFYDLGIRNAVIRNFKPLALRQDVGALWENYLIVERMKCLHNAGILYDAYFWRTTQQQEIDYIEERDGRLHAWQFKWNPNARIKISKTFTRNYPDAETGGVNRRNASDFLLPEL